MYLKHSTNDKDCLKVSCLLFYFDRTKFILQEDKLTAADIFETVSFINNMFNLINQNGFVTKTDPNTIIPILYSHIKSRGFKIKEHGFGFNENTYRM